MNPMKTTAVALLTTLASVAGPAHAACPDLSDGTWTCTAILPMDGLDVSATCDHTFPEDTDSASNTYALAGDPSYFNAALADPTREVLVTWAFYGGVFSFLHTDATPSAGDVAAHGRIVADFVYDGVAYDSGMRSASLYSAGVETTELPAAFYTPLCHDVPPGVTDFGLFELEVETAVLATCSVDVEASATAEVTLAVNPLVCARSE